MTHPNEELARSEMEAALRGDFDGMLAHYSEDVVLHYPGRNALSGTYRGKDGIGEWVRKIDELLGPGDRSPARYMTSWRATTMLSNSCRWSPGEPTGEVSLDRSDLLGLLAPRLAEPTLSTFHYLQEANQLG